MFYLFGGMTLYHFDIVLCINLNPISGLNSRCLIKLIGLINNYYTLIRVTIKYKGNLHGILHLREYSRKDKHGRSSDLAGEGVA